MAIKRKNTMSGSLSKKGKELDVDKLKEQVKNLHSKPEEAEKLTKDEKERIIRLSIDAPEGVYWEMKKRVLHDRLTVKKYVLKLIRKDLGME